MLAVLIALASPALAGELVLHTTLCDTTDIRFKGRSLGSITPTSTVVVAGTQDGTYTFEFVCGSATREFEVKAFEAARMHYNEGGAGLVSTGMRVDFRQEMDEPFDLPEGAQRVVLPAHEMPKTAAVVEKSDGVQVTVGPDTPAEFPWFQGTVADAQAKAKAEGKKLFIYATTAWVGPGRFMEQKVLTEERVRAYFHQNFVSIRIDCEKDDGPQFARQNGVRAYPMMLVRDGSGAELRRTMGAKRVEQLLEFAESAK